MQSNQISTPEGAGVRGTQAPKMWWEVVAVYDGARHNLRIKTFDLRRTLEKLLKHENLITVAIKPKGHFYYYWVDKEELQKLLDGELVHTVITCHAPSIAGEGEGYGKINLDSLMTPAIPMEGEE